jgi:hypothetical protein
MLILLRATRPRTHRPCTRASLTLAADVAARRSSACEVPREGVEPSWGVAHGALDGARLPFRHLDLFLLHPDARPGPRTDRPCTPASLILAVPGRHSAIGNLRTIRDKGSNLDLRVQSAVSCRLDDPGACASVQLGRELDASAPSRSSLSEPETYAKSPMSMPLAYPSTLDRRPRVCTSAGRRRRGGALEPEPRTLSENVHAKAKANACALFSAPSAEESFSLRRGLDSIWSFSS